MLVNIALIVGYLGLLIERKLLVWQLRSFGLGILIRETLSGKEQPRGFSDKVQANSKVDMTLNCIHYAGITNEHIYSIVGLLNVPMVVMGRGIPYAVFRSIK
jgi:hypothetical protein